MSTQTDWLIEVSQAAEDLGYGIRAIGPHSIELYRGADVTLTIDSHGVSGALLRDLLRPRADPVAAGIIGAQPSSVPA